MMKRRASILLIALLLSALLIVPAFAQDSAPAAAQTPAPESSGEVVTGAGTLMLLLGVGAVLIVGGLSILRENASKNGG